MKILYKIILTVSVLIALVLVFFLLKTPKIETEAKTWNGEYMQVLSEPYNQTEVAEGFGKFDDIFGGMRPSNFKTTLSRSLAATASTSETLYTTSLTTKDSHVLTDSDIGDFVCMHINPGASNDEIVCCTGISSTNFTGCTRGYNFYSTGTTSGNAKSHSPGEIIVVSDDDHYLSTQYPQLDSDATITGLYTFAGDNIASIQFGSGSTTYDKRIYIYNGETNKPYLGYDESADQWVISNNGTDTYVVASGSSSFTGGDGILITSSVMDVEIASTSGLYFSSDRYLSIYPSSSWNSLYVDDDGLVSVGSGSFEFNEVSISEGFEVLYEFSAISNGAVSVSALTLGTALDETYGGTGTVSWDKYDILYADADNQIGNIASGSDGDTLGMRSGVPTMASPLGSWQTLHNASTEAYRATMSYDGFVILINNTGNAQTMILATEANGSGGAQTTRCGVIVTTATNNLASCLSPIKKNEAIVFGDPGDGTYTIYYIPFSN